ncbi:MAG: Hpt domain-containing protein [Eubacteriales bacterium]|nr:Hpt domain-containing protein [Eubacteriales bacterium]
MNIEKLKEAGIDYEAGLKRFANKSALYEKYLTKFFLDTSFADLGTYIAEKNTMEAFKCAHTLKGLSGNLSITSFYKLISVMVEELRNSNVESVDEMYDQLAKIYDSVRVSVLEPV